MTTFNDTFEPPFKDPFEPPFGGAGVGPPPFTNTLSTSFNGIDEYVSMGNVFTATNNISIIAWVKTTSGVNGNFIGRYGDAGGGLQWFIGLHNANGGMRGIVSGGGVLADKNYQSSEAINDGAWHMVCMTFATNVLKMYIDGVLIVPNKISDTVVNSIFNTNNDLRMGAHNSAPLDFQYDGLLDEISIWSVNVLSDADVLALYNGGTPFDVTTHPTAAGLAGYWRMGDGDTAPTIFDNSGLNRDGTMVNMDGSNFIADVP